MRSNATPAGKGLQRNPEQSAGLLVPAFFFSAVTLALTWVYALGSRGAQNPEMSSKLCPIQMAVEEVFETFNIQFPL